MKKVLLALLVLAFAAALWLVLKRPVPQGDESISLSPAATNAERTRPSPLSVSNQPPVSMNGTGFLSKAQRSRISTEERLRWLQGYGQVPEDADHIDWRLAQQTSWWGKGLNSDQFWTNRVVWLSATNQMDARRHGRMYPPIPLNYAAETKHEDDIPVGTGWSVEGPNIAFRVSNSEAGFWSEFARTHPRPPEDIERQQLDIAGRILRRRRDVERGGNRPRRTPDQLGERNQRTKQEPLEWGYPPEMVSDDALFWSYVLKKRQEHQEIVRTLEQAGLPLDGPRMSIFQRTLLVDPKYVTEDLTQEQMSAANAWKLEYLRRLKRENADQSYITAYLQAWNMKPEDVFAPANRP